MRTYFARINNTIIHLDARTDIEARFILKNRPSGSFGIEHVLDTTIKEGVLYERKDGKNRCVSFL